MELLDEGEVLLHQKLPPTTECLVSRSVTDRRPAICSHLRRQNLVQDQGVDSNLAEWEEQAVASQPT